MKNKKLTKMFLVFFVYFFYTMYAHTIFNAIGIKDSIMVNFIPSFLFMIFIIFMYKDNLKKDYKRLKKDYSTKKIVLTIVKWVIILFVSNMIFGIITDVLAPGLKVDKNTEEIYNLSSLWYTIFKTMIFGTLAEEILYRESIRDNVKNKFLFIVLSALIYTGLNFVFTGLPEKYLLVNILIYFMPAIVCSIAYVRNDNNILLLALIKFCYNLIPLAVLLLGL